MKDIAANISDVGEEASSRWALIAALVGPVALLAAALLVFTLVPSSSGAEAATKTAEFYSDDGDGSTLVIAEPLALIGMFAFLGLTGHVRHGLRAIDATNQWPAMAFAGGVAFSVLAAISLVAQTTVAGAGSFSPSFEADPHTAMLLSHFGYLTLAAALIGGSVMAFSVAGALRPTNRRSATVAYVVGALGLIGMLFVYLPLTVFLLWVAVMGVKLRSRTRAG